MKCLLILTMLLCSAICKSKMVYKMEIPRTGFIYSKGITWTETPKQDSVLDIIIEGDTMTAIRNLLLYCLQEKEENEHSYYLLSRLDLDYIATLTKNKEFKFYLKKYRSVVEKNNLKRGIYPKKKP